VARLAPTRSLGGPDPQSGPRASSGCVCQVDGRNGSHDVLVLQGSPPAGVLPIWRRPSATVTKSGVDDPRVERNRTIKRKPQGPTFRAALRPSPSMSGAPFRSRAAQFDLAGVPPLDLRSQPQARPASTEIEDGTGHVGVPVHILADGIAMSEPQDPGNVVRVDQIIDEHPPGHKQSLHLTADVAYTCELSVRPLR
jgi:hypothetical protein